jgi:hypothetical protein
MLAPREVVSVDVPVPFDTAWAHLRQPELIRRWYGWDDPDLDDVVAQVFGHEAIVQRADSGLPVGWLRWHNHDRIEAHGGWGGAPRTTITVRRPDHALLASYDGVRDEVDERWITWLHQLRYALTHHLGEERHSFAVRGLDGDRPDRLLYRVGLHGARGVPLGGAVEVHRPDGSVIGGTLEYCAPHQFGVALRGACGSLLVVQLVPPASHPPNGAVNAFWSTYGLDDETLDAARERWHSWWRTPVLARR